MAIEPLIDASRHAPALRAWRETLPDDSAGRLFMAYGCDDGTRWPFGLSWSGADSTTILSAAIGAAWCVSPASGRALAFVTDLDSLACGRMHEALALARHLAVGPSLVVVSPPIAPLAESTIVAHGWQLRHRTHLGWKTALAASQQPLWIIAEEVALDDDQGQPHSFEYQEVPPVLLPYTALPAADESLIGTGDSRESLRRWLSAIEDDRLLILDMHPDWSGAAPCAASLIAAGHCSSEGFRVLWNLDRNVACDRLVAGMKILAARRLVLTLVMPPGNQPMLFQPPLVPEWIWLAPVDHEEALAMIRTGLAGEQLQVVQLPENDCGAHGDDTLGHHPGHGRWLRRGGSAAIVCHQRTVIFALAIADDFAARGHDLTVFNCSSWWPLPETELCDLACSAPLLVVDAGAGLYAAIAGLCYGNSQQPLWAVASDESDPAVAGAPLRQWWDRQH